MAREDEAEVAELRRQVADHRRALATQVERVKAEKARGQGAWRRMARRALKDLQVEYDAAVHRAASEPSRENDGELRALARLRKRWNKELGAEGEE